MTLLQIRRDTKTAHRPQFRGCARERVSAAEQHRRNRLRTEPGKRKWRPESPIGAMSSSPYGSKPGKAAMTYDETWDDRPARRFSLAPLVPALFALVACLAAVAIWLQQRSVADDRAALQVRVSALEHRMARLSGKDAALSNRLG